MNYALEEIIFGLVFVYVTTYVTYMYSCWYQDKNIREKVEIYNLITKTEFYVVIYFIVIKYNPAYKSKRDYNAYNEAKKIYKENKDFRIECYKEGIKPRLLEIINKLD
jgi:hypothetical protein